MLAGLEVEPAEEPGSRLQDPDPSAFRPRDHPNGAHQLVFHRQSGIQEGDDEFLGSAVEGDAQEDLIGSSRALPGRGHLPGADVETLLGFTSLRRVPFGFHDPGLQAVPAQSGQLPQQVDQVVSSREVAAGHLRAQVSLNEDRLARIQPLDQSSRVGRERVNPFGGEIDPPSQAVQQQRQSGQGDHQGHPPHQQVGTHGRCLAAAGPVASSQQLHVEIDHGRRKGEEVGHRGKRDHTRGQVLELLVEGEAGHQPFGAPGQDGACMVDEDGHGAEQGAQDEGHGDVVGQEGPDHSQGQQRHSHEPVAQVGGGHQAGVRVAQPSQHQHVGQGKEEGHGVDAGGSQVLPQHDAEVGGRQGQQQLVGAVALLLGPDAHADGGNQKDQQVGEDAVELVQIGQVVGEEPVLPEGRQGAQKDEEGDEDVTGGAAEVAGQLPLADDPGQLPMALHAWVSLACGSGSCSAPGTAASEGVGPCGPGAETSGSEGPSRPFLPVRR